LILDDIKKNDILYNQLKMSGFGTVWANVR